MRAKVQKCCALGLQASSAKIYNPELQLQDQIIPYAGNKSIPFLGGTISVPVDRWGQKTSVEGKLKRYSDLTSEARERGYQSLTIPVQVGGRGVLEEYGLGQLRKILKPVSDKAWKTFLLSLTRSVTIRSASSGIRNKD